MIYSNVLIYIISVGSGVLVLYLVYIVLLLPVKIPSPHNVWPELIRYLNLKKRGSKNCAAPTK